MNCLPDKRMAIIGTRLNLQTCSLASQPPPQFLLQYPDIERNQRTVNTLKDVEKLHQRCSCHRSLNLGGMVDAYKKNLGQTICLLLGNNILRFFR